MMNTSIFQCPDVSFNLLFCIVRLSNLSIFVEGVLYPDQDFGGQRLDRGQRDPSSVGTSRLVEGGRSVFAERCQKNYKQIREGRTSKNQRTLLWRDFFKNIFWFGVFSGLF